MKWLNQVKRKLFFVEMDEVTCKEFGAPHNKLKIGS